jgi:taurine dioxygenase
MLKATRLTPHIGVEVSGADLAGTSDEATIKEVLALLDENGVVVMRGQALSVEQFMGFSKRVGPLAVHSLKQFSKPGFPELMVNSNIVENGKPLGLADGGQHWHTDGAYLGEPYRATILYAVEVPVQNGVALGDTMFTSTAAAYDALPADMKERLSIRRGVHCHGVARAKKAKPLALDAEQEAKLAKTVEHPAIRTHPYTGRKCVYVNPGSTLRVTDMPEDESDATLKTLFAHVTRPEFVYRHKWRVGDVVMWDNCSTQHCAVGDYHPLRRLLYRTIVQGTKPF